MLVECGQLSKSESSLTGNRRNNEERYPGKFLSDELLLDPFGPQLPGCRLILSTQLRISTKTILYVLAVTLNAIITDLTLGWN